VTSAVAEREMITPAWVHVPPRAGSLAEQVTAVSASVGRHLDEEQQFAVDVLTSRRADGTPAALEGAAISCRQNLKTFIGEDIVLTYMVEPESDVRLAVWSAHEFATSQETFRHFDELCAGYPHLSRRVRRIWRGNGEEAIEFVGGRRLIFRARTKAGGRGLTGDVIVLDEAFALQPAHMGALLPTLSTRRRAQVLYLSSAGLGHSGVLRGVRDRGRRGGVGAPAYVEWCAPGALDEPGCEVPKCSHAVGTPGCSLDREDFWQVANPAMGRRITVEFIRQERAALPPAEFARERLGWWDEPDDADASPIPVDQWLACSDPAGQIEGTPVLGLDVAPDGGSASISLAGQRGDGMVQVEVVVHRDGDAWILGELRQAFAAGMRVLAVDGGKSQAATYRTDAEAIGFTVLELGAGDMASACMGLQRDVRSGDRLRHVEDPSEPGAVLSQALVVAAVRPLGDAGGWAWARKRTDGDITPLVAVTVARWGLLSQADQAAYAIADWGD